VSALRPDPGVLLLADGTRWPATSVGAPGAAVGEVVFTTAMTGYAEALTDPSYHGQLLLFTAPMIGNYGVETDALESGRVQPRAMLCHELRGAAPSGRVPLDRWLIEAGVVALAELDTRALVRHLRDQGSMTGVACGTGADEAAAADLLSTEPTMAGRSLAADVSGELSAPDRVAARCRVVLVDYGAKRNMVRLLEAAGAEVEVVPHDVTAEEILAREPDGVLLGSGPGDPAAMNPHVEEIRRLMDGTGDAPVFGICLGHQLLARALGLETFKLPFGHRGANHPVLERESGRVLITSQNHGFAVRAPDGPTAAQVTHESLYDHTVEGLRLPGRPVWSVQFHPEAAPGPHDARERIAAFVQACAERSPAAAVH
jgi:carbamoyl-phosphate synthase small subunit